MSSTIQRRVNTSPCWSPSSIPNTLTSTSSPRPSDSCRPTFRWRVTIGYPQASWLISGSRWTDSRWFTWFDLTTAILSEGCRRDVPSGMLRRG